MAERSVIREDVVSIGFEVENAPFGDLANGVDGLKASLGLLDDTEAGLKDINREAGLAQDTVGGLVDSLRGPLDKEGLAEPVENVGDAADDAQKGIQGLGDEMEQIPKIGLTDGIEEISPAMKHPISSMKDLAGKAASFAKEKLDAGVKKLQGPLQSAAGLTGKVLGVAKDLAGIGFQKTVSGMKSLADQSGRAAKALGGKALSGLTSLGKGVAAGITVGSVALAGMGTAAVMAGSDFDSSFAKASTLFGDVDVQIDQLKKNLLSVSNDTGLAASELNEAMYSALSAGIPATEDMAGMTSFLGASAKLAKAGFTDMDTALSATAKTLNAYGLDVSEADRINKVLIQTQNKGITTVGELGASLAQVTPTAAAFGVSFENVGAALSNMTAAGTPTAQATTQLNSLIAELGKSGTTGAKSLEKAAKGTKYAGMGFKEMLDAGAPLNEVLDMIQKSADASGLSMVDMFSSIEAGKAALALSGENSEKFTSNLEAMGTSADVVTEAYEKVSDTLENKTAQIANSARNLGIGVYNEIQAPLKGLADDGLGYLEELSGALQEGGIDGLVGQLGNTLSEAVTTVGGYLPSVVESGAAIADSLVEGLLDNQDEILGSVTESVFALGEGVLRVAPKMMTAGMGLATSLAKGVVSNLPRLVPAAAQGIRTLKEGLFTYGPELVATAGGLVGQLANGLIASAPAVTSSASGLVVSLVDGIAQGAPSVMVTGVTLVGSVASGIAANAPQLLSSGINLVVSVAQGIGQSIPTLFQSAGSIIGSLLEGIISNIPNLLTGAWEIVKALVEGILSTDWLQVGIDIISGIYNGIKSWFGGGEESGAEISESVASGIDTEKLETSGQQLSASLADGLESGTPQLQLAAAGQTDALQESFQAGFTDIQVDVSGFSKDVKATIDSTDLYGSGQNIMRGLNSGMLSMQGTLNATASSIGSGISSSLNQSLDIHSPSKVTEETGYFTGLGMVKGLDGMKGKVLESARGIGGTVAKNIVPFQSRYTPETSPGVTNNHSSSQVSNYHPVFNLTLNGASASDSNERKVKRWVKESMKECFDGIGRSQPKPQEV